MNFEDRYVLYKKAIERWGKEPQINLAIEECGELIVALSKRNRNSNGSTIDDIIGEMADVEIMIEQLKIIYKNECSAKFGCFTFDIFKKKKLQKLKGLLK